MCSATNHNSVNQYQQQLSVRVKNLPALPTVLMELNQLLAQDNVSAASVAELIKTDAALALRLLRIANSPFYGQARPIENLNQATVLVGVSEIANMARCLAMIDTTGKMEAWRVLDATRFWRSSMAISAIAKTLSRQIDYPAQPDLAACLYNIGICVLADSFGDEYASVLAAQDSLEQAERQLFGFDHHDAKSQLLSHWQFEDEASLVSNNSHQRGQRAAQEKDSATLLSIVSVADSLAEMLGYSPCDRWTPMQDPRRLLTSVGADADCIEDLITVLAQHANNGAYSAGSADIESLYQHLTRGERMLSVYIDDVNEQPVSSIYSEAISIFIHGIGAKLCVSADEADIVISCEDRKTDGGVGAVVMNISDYLKFAAPEVSGSQPDLLADAGGISILDGESEPPLLINWGLLHSAMSQAVREHFPLSQAGLDAV